MYDNLDHILHLVWPIGDPFERALWLGALAALAHRHPAYLNDELSALAERCAKAFRPRTLA